MLNCCVRLFVTPRDCSPPGSSVHGILQARIQEWVAISSSRGSYQPGYRTHVSCVSCFGRWILWHWGTSVQFSSVTQLCPTLCDPMNCSIPGLSVHHQLLELSNSCPSSWWCHPAFILCFLLLLLPPIPPSIRVFFSESTLRMRWPKYWSFSFSLSPSNEQSGLISFRMDWLDLFAVQETLKSLVQHHSSKQKFFSSQLSSQSNTHIHTWPLEKP